MTSAFVLAPRAVSWLSLLIALPALALGAASTAHAQSETCVLLPSPSTQAPVEVRDQVMAVVAEELREHGNVVLATRDAQLRMLEQPMRECAAIDCAASVNRFLGTTFAVLTEIAWVGSRVTMVNIAIIGLDDGESVGGQAEVIAGDVDAATRGAFQAAWDRYAAAQQGYVVVESTPPGAFVELDGASLGRAPLRRLVRAGIHTLRVTLEGYRSVAREITVDRHEVREISLTLSPGTGEDTAGAGVSTSIETPSAPLTRDEAHWANYLIGGALIAGGIGALVVPLWTLAELGNTIEEGSASAPGTFVDFGAGSGVLMGVGVAAIVAGALVMITAPIRASVSVTPEHSSLTLWGSF